MANGSASIFRPGLRRTPHVWLRLAVALLLTLAPSGLLFGTSPLNNGRILRRLHRKLVRSCGEVAGDDAKHKDAYVDKVESSGNGEFKLSAAARENFAAIEKVFPDQSLRARTLFLVTPRNPYLTQELNPAEKQSYEASLRNWSETLNNAGFQAFPLGIDYDSEDFIDAHHFSNRGAPKMAADVAARVRRMAERNDWTNQAIE